MTAVDGRADPAPVLLVIGARGQVGYELVRELAPLGRVVAYTREECDLGNPAAAADAVWRAAPTLVVNAAAYTAVDRAEQDVAACRTANAEAPGRMAAVAASLGVPFVHYSTDYVFDGTKEGAYVEDDAPNPLGVYGRTKLDGERAVADASPAYLVFRTSWVYAARGQNFLRTMLRLARERDELRVVNDQVGAPTWARAIAAATAQVVGAALRAPEGAMAWVTTRAGVYHLTAAGETSWHGFAEAILAADPARLEQRVRRVVPVATAAFPTPARRPANSRLDCRRAADRLGVRLTDWCEQLHLALNV